MFSFVFFGRNWKSDAVVVASGDGQLKGSSPGHEAYTLCVDVNGDAVRRRLPSGKTPAVTSRWSFTGRWPLVSERVGKVHVRIARL